MKKPPKWPGYLLGFRIEVNGSSAIPLGYWNMNPLLRISVNATPCDMTGTEMYHARMGHCSRCVYREIVRVEYFGNRENDAAQRWENNESVNEIMQIMHGHVVRRLQKSGKHRANWRSPSWTNIEP